MTTVGPEIESNVGPDISGGLLVTVKSYSCCGCPSVKVKSKPDVSSATGVWDIPWVVG